jgi:hypothetical protein
MARNKVARELEANSLVLDQNPRILDLVLRDLVKYQRTDTGRAGRAGGARRHFEAIPGIAL